MRVGGQQQRDGEHVVLTKRMPTRVVATGCDWRGAGYGSALCS